MGRLFDTGGWGPSLALAALGLVALLSAAACGLLDLRHAGSGTGPPHRPHPVPATPGAAEGSDSR